MTERPAAGDAELELLLRSAAWAGPVRLQLSDAILVTLLALLERLRPDRRIHPAQWDEMDPADREYLLARGQMILISASGVHRKTFYALPARIRAQSVILLRGAEVLGIDTAWGGWNDEE